MTHNILKAQTPPAKSATSNGALYKDLRHLMDVLIAVYKTAMDSASYFAITVIALAAVMAIAFTGWPVLFPWAASTTASLYVVMLLLQIAHRARQRSEWNMQEVGERIAGIDNVLGELRDLVERNHV